MPVDQELTTRILSGWVEAELAPWQDTSLDGVAVNERLRADARRNGQICLYRIRDYEVSFAPFTTMHRPFLLDPQHSGGSRAHMYLTHLRDVVRTYELAGSALIGVFLADHQLPRPQSPVFCYQKHVGSRALLLPDVDLLSDDYCGVLSGRYDDPIPFGYKLPEAVFVGSTTGTELLTIENVQSRSNARLDAAMFFRGKAGVTFRLPNVVQCDSPATRAAIENLGVGGVHWSWLEQQRFRYMISMDGNGATCSRVAATLHGNQVLVKYSSPYVLYYFYGLEPWVHYIPVNEHEDVFDVLAERDVAYATHHRIANHSKYFAQQFLNRASIMEYSALLLERYINLFGDGALG